MTIRVLAFAGAREMLGAPHFELDLPSGASVRDAWSRLEAEFPGLAPHRSSLRVAHNGSLADLDGALRDGDELALLPPVGGG
ncbi:MAG TPA: MoaD/ThiS family protein [Candidatus Cybelea sp.]|nr:MoaD/ThiS family protein [Candidatus Cybelea sp.]